MVRRGMGLCGFVGDIGGDTGEVSTGVGQSGRLCLVSVYTGILLAAVPLLVRSEPDCCVFCPLIVGSVGLADGRGLSIVFPDEFVGGTITFWEWGGDITGLIGVFG
jgi:hypothetical protein